MNSELKATVRGIAAVILVLLAGCGGGGDSVSVEPPAPVPPEPVDPTPIDVYPTIRYQYFLGDDYSTLDSNGRPLVWSYQTAVADSKVAQVSRTWPARIVRPKVAPTRRNMTYAYGVLQERNGLWSLTPDQSGIPQLTNLRGPFCDRELPEDDYLVKNQSYFYGFTRANAGIYVVKAGADGVCATADDEYWEVPLTASDAQPAKQVSREIVYAQELLDANLNLLGFIYAEPGQPIKTFDAQGNFIKQLGVANSHVTLHKHYDGNLAALALGNDLYFVDNPTLVSPAFELPQPVYTASAPLDVRNVRLDKDRIYLLDGASLIGIDYLVPSQVFKQTLANISNLQFDSGNHGSVFSKNHIFVRTDSMLGTRHLLAIAKQDGRIKDLSQVAIAGQPVRFDVADEYFATDNYLYFSFADANVGESGYKAYVYEEAEDGTLSERRHYDLARWFFYQDHTQNNSSQHALLMVAKVTPLDKDGNVTRKAISNEGFFYTPTFYSYDPTAPDPATVEPPVSGINRKHGEIPTRDFTLVRELSDAESGHLMIAVQTLNAEDPISVFYSPPPNKAWKSLKTGTNICERGIARLSAPTNPPCSP